MGKTLERFNKYTFSIPDDFKETWNEFVTIAQKDKALLQKLAPNNAGRPISLALRTAIKMYLNFKRHPEVISNAAPVEAADSEEGDH